MKIAASFVRALPDRMEVTVRMLNRSTASDGGTDGNGVCPLTAADDSSDAVAAEDTESEIVKLREVYEMGEAWFGSAFVLQVSS